MPAVNTYIRRMYEKLHVRSRAQAVAKYAHLAGAEERPPLAPGPENDLMGAVMHFNDMLFFPTLLLSPSALIGDLT